MADKSPSTVPPADLSPLGGDNPRRETAGCPTGLANLEQAAQAQRPGGGGAPGTGAADPAAAPTHPAFSPGEGITEKELERSGKQ